MLFRSTNRLNVLRGLLAEVTNAAKTAQPLGTDLKLLGLLRERSSAAAQAAEEFSNAGRADLTEKEIAAIKVLEEYTGNVETVSEDYINDVVQSTIDSIKAEAQGARSSWVICSRSCWPLVALSRASLSRNCRSQRPSDKSWAQSNRSLRLTWSIAGTSSQLDVHAEFESHTLGKC